MNTRQKNTSKSDNMGRNRKDSTGSNVVDTYRKQIAKQDTKKSKENLRDIKNKSDKKENAPAIYKDISILIGAMIVLFFCVYCIFYAIISESHIKEQS